MPSPGPGRSLPLAVCDHRSSALLEITWADQQRSRLPHGWLRRHCRCAACQQQQRHGSAGAAVPDDVRDGVHLQEIRTVGDHGLNLVFSDGHARGIYPWPYLRELGDALAVAEG